MSKPSTPVSERRLAANRANAQKSTGPRTPEGKAASSQNAVKHGFRSSSFAVVRFEELDEVAKLKADAIACYRPVNAQELFAVEQIALAQHQMLRAGRLEAGLFTDAMNLAVDRYDNPIRLMDDMLIGTGDIEICKAQNRNYCLGEGFRRMAKESKVWSLMLRYQSQAERMYRRAIEDFERLKALRGERKGDHSGRRFARFMEELPNEPNVGTEPEEKEQVAPVEPLNQNSRKAPDSPAPATAQSDVPPASSPSQLKPAPKLSPAA